MNSSRNGLLHCLYASFLAVMLCFPLYAMSADIQALGQGFDKIEGELDRTFFTSSDLEGWSKQISEAQSDASSCIDKRGEELVAIQKSIDSLGEAADTEPAEVQDKRKQVEQKKSDVEKALSNCRLLLLRSQELSETISEESNALLAKELLARSPTIFTLLSDNLKDPNALASGFKLYLEQGTGLDVFTPTQWIAGLLVVVGMLFAGFKFRRILINSIRHEAWHDDFPSRFSLALFSTVTHYLPHLIAACSAAALIYLYTHELQPVPFVAQVAFGLVVYYIAVILIRFLFVPVPPGKRFLPLTPSIAKRLARRLVVLVLLGLVGYLAFYTDIANRIPDNPLLLARRIFSLIVVLNMVWALWILFRSPKLTEIRWLIILVIAALLVTLGAEWLGYQNLAFYLRRMVLGLILVFGATLMLSKLSSSIFNGIDDGSYIWSRNLRKMLAVPDDQPVPGSGWLRLLIGALIWIGFAVASLRVLDTSDEVLGSFNQLVLHGFDIGSLHITPVRIFYAIISLSLLLTLIGWLRSRLEKRWLQRVQMDRGAREAMVTISGYVMIMLAILFALSIAGLDFSNLAIIAGALSVGIGFGLQNIVNNFVSGLILLFERPIKTGDWVMVGQTEGYVKRIRIRATQIQTFDRSDVIVPNSELISQQLTNWMYQNQYGRARIAVGVAYGTDTEKVKETLLSVAAEHPRVIKSPVAPQPNVLFINFGDSSLNFELRVFIYNINERLSVISDLNFAIDKAFREQGIEIPFPQRDVHIRRSDESFPGDHE